MNKDAQIVIGMSADTLSLLEGLSNVEHAFKHFADNIQQQSNNLSKSIQIVPPASVIAAQFGVISGIFKTVTNKLFDPLFDLVKGPLGHLADGIAHSFTEMFEGGKIASGLGLMVNEFQEMKYAARISGIEVEGLNRVLINLNRSIGSAVNGDKKKNAIFDAMGLDPSALATKSPKDALMDIAKALQAIGNTSQRASVAGTIFTTKGQQLGQLLEFMKALANEGERMEAVFKNITVPFGKEEQEQINQGNVALINMKTIWESITNTIASRLATPLARIVAHFTDIKGIGKSIGDVVDDIVGKLQGAMVLLAGFGTVLYNLFTRVATLIDTVMNNAGTRAVLGLAGMGNAFNLAGQLQGQAPGGKQPLMGGGLFAGVQENMEFIRNLFKPFPSKEGDNKSPFINDEFIHDKIKTVPLGFAQNLSQFAGSGAGAIEALKAASQKVQQVEDLGVTKELVGISKKLDNVGKVK